MQNLEHINWLQVAIGFLSGGAFGAFIKQYFDNRRNRVQTIGQSVDIKSFYDSGENSLMNSEVSLTGTTQVFKFQKLYTGTITVANTGLHDYPTFTFGITCPEHVKVIHVKPESTDRHHVAEVKEPPALENQISSFDICLKPFNRRDSYTFNILATTLDGDLTAADIRISSSSPVKWANLTPTSKLIVEIAKETFLAVGPVSIGFKR